MVIFSSVLLICLKNKDFIHFISFLLFVYSIIINIIHKREKGIVLHIKLLCC